MRKNPIVVKDLVTILRDSNMYGTLVCNYLSHMHIFSVLEFWSILFSKYVADAFMQQESDEMCQPLFVGLLNSLGVPVLRVCISLNYVIAKA